MAIDFGRDLIVRWPDAQVGHVPLLRGAGIQAVVLPAPQAEFQEACGQAGIQTLVESELVTVKMNQLPAGGSGRPYVALSTGLWPGISRGGSRASPDDETASASHEPWVDSNGYRVAYLRALYPGSAAVLAYQANAAAGLRADRLVPFDTLELALIEARAMGGNYILSLDPKFREPLLKGDAKAVAAWNRLGVTAKWLASNASLLEQPMAPAIVEVVEPGEGTSEIANLLFRRNASPRLTSGAGLPKPSAGTLAVVATGLRAPGAEIGARILEHAMAGSTVVTDDVAPNAWWRAAALKVVKKQEDRTFYSLGKGLVVAYHEKVVNPSEHALDVIDYITHARRAVRIWNANAVIAAASSNTVRLFNYGTPARSEIQVRIQGHFRSAELLRPEGAPLPLEAKHRGSTTEVFVTSLERFGVVVFS